MARKASVTTAIVASSILENSSRRHVAVRVYRPQSRELPGPHGRGQDTRAMAGETPASRPRKSVY